MPCHLYHTKFVFFPAPYITNVTEKISGGFHFQGHPLFLANADFTCLLARSLCSRYLWACFSFPLLLLLPKALVVVLFLPWAVHATWAPVVHTLSASPSISAGKAQHHKEPLERARRPRVTEQLHQQWHLQVLVTKRALGPAQETTFSTVHSKILYWLPNLKSRTPGPLSRPQNVAN